MRINGLRIQVRAVIDGTKVQAHPIKASEAEKILAWTGYDNLQELEIRASDSDPLACRALLALLEFRKGNHVRFAEVDIEDVDGIEADLYDETGRVVTFATGPDGKYVVEDRKIVLLFDGEREPAAPAVPTQAAPSID